MRAPWLLALLIACGNDSAAVDAPVGPSIDGAAAIDAPPGAPDAPMIDAPPPPVIDASPIDASSSPIDASPVDAMPLPMVSCNGTTCDPFKVCCVSSDLTTFSCVTAAKCEGQQLTCDGPEDCAMAGTTCCFTAGTACLPEVVCGLEVCHVDGDCGAGLVCCPFAGDTRVCVAGECPDS